MSLCIFICKFIYIYAHIGVKPASCRCLYCRNLEYVCIYVYIYMLIYIYTYIGVKPSSCRCLYLRNLKLEPLRGTRYLYLDTYSQTG